MILFPLFTDIENKRFLIVGHGGVAQRKIVKTAEYTGNITVVTGEAVDGGRLRELETVCRNVQNRELRKDDLKCADICICAFGGRAFHEKLYIYCKENRIPLNVVDVPDMCTFVFPAMIKRGDLIAAVSTSGKSPGYAAAFKRKIEDLIPDNVEEILDYMGALRERLPDVITEQSVREKVYKNILGIIFGTGNVPSRDRTEEIINAVKEKYIQNKKETAPGDGR